MGLNYNDIRCLMEWRRDDSGGRVVTLTGESLLIDNPALLPPIQEIDHIEEPFILATLHVPTEFLGNVLQLCQERRGAQRELKYLSTNRAVLLYELPLNEVVIDFHDRLKSVTRGYASFDYDLLDLRASFSEGWRRGGGTGA